MKITVNGKSEEMRERMTVEEFLRARNLDVNRVAVEIDLEIIPRDRFRSTCIEAGNRLEILHFVGGG